MSCSAYFPIYIKTTENPICYIDCACDPHRPTITITKILWSNIGYIHTNTVYNLCYYLLLVISTKTVKRIGLIDNHNVLFCTFITLTQSFLKYYSVVLCSY